MLRSQRGGSRSRTTAARERNRGDIRSHDGPRVAPVAERRWASSGPVSFCRASNMGAYWIGLWASKKKESAFEAFHSLPIALMLLYWYASAQSDIRSSFTILLACKQRLAHAVHVHVSVLYMRTWSMWVVDNISMLQGHSTTDGAHLFIINLVTACTVRYTHAACIAIARLITE